LIKAEPVVSPGPVTMLTTPSGSPASYRISPSSSAVNGVCSAGFKTTVQPAAIAGASFQPAITIGKFHGIICAHTPTGSRSVRSSPGADTGMVSPMMRVAARA
jgi:hypothetical protein